MKCPRCRLSVMVMRTLPGMDRPLFVCGRCGHRQSFGKAVIAKGNVRGALEETP